MEAGRESSYLPDRCRHSKHTSRFPRPETGKEGIFPGIFPSQAEVTARARASKAGIQKSWDLYFPPIHPRTAERNPTTPGVCHHPGSFLQWPKQGTREPSGHQLNGESWTNKTKPSPGTHRSVLTRSRGCTVPLPRGPGPALRETGGHRDPRPWGLGPGQMAQLPFPHGASDHPISVSLSVPQKHHSPQL